jgi:hypothetical protein
MLEAPKASAMKTAATGKLAPDDIVMRRTSANVRAINSALASTTPFNPRWL